MSENPLSKLGRTKQVYVSLPSGGHFYKNGITLTSDGEIGIKPMTNTDELRLKSPDAVFNGEALKDVFLSTVPDINNPLEIPICDVDVLLIGIYIASTGKTMGITQKCPKCDTEHSYDVDLTKILATATPIDPTKNIAKLVLDGHNIEVHTKPYTYQTQVKTNMQQFYTARIEYIVNNQGLKSDEKVDLFNEALLASAALQIEIIAGGIEKVIIDGEVEVTEHEHIYNWVKDLDKASSSVISNIIKGISNTELDNVVKLQCDNCEHEFDVVIELEPQRLFFGG